MLFAVVGAASLCRGQANVHDTKYDWSGLANSITSPSKSDYEKAYDIYTWLTHNIAYDTSYSIFTADETYEQRRGVCQGYSELFYRLGEAVGLRCDVISGKSKNPKGVVGDEGHAWLFVYTDGNAGILVDPTWGAGSVSDGRFTRHPSDKWFHVSPEWLIFSHFPDEGKYQLLESPVGFDAFRRISYYDPELGGYGYDGKEFLASEISGKVPQIPEFSSKVIADKTRGIKVPLQRELRVGSPYEFYVLPTGSDVFVIHSGDDYVRDWVRSEGQAAIRFIPATAGSLVVGVEAQDGYTYMVEYTVAEPTRQDIARLEEACPLRSPSLSSLGNYDLSNLEAWGVEPHRLLAAVKSEGIGTLPRYNASIECRMVDVPLDGRLRVGESYSFRFTPGKGNAFAAINGEAWTMDWVQNPDGTVSLAVTPTVSGELKISARIGEDMSYWPILTYTVE